MGTTVMRHFLVLFIGSLLLTIVGCSDANESNHSTSKGVWPKVKLPERWL